MLLLLKVFQRLGKTRRRLRSCKITKTPQALASWSFSFDLTQARPLSPLSFRLPRRHVAARQSKRNHRGDAFLFRLKLKLHEAKACGVLILPHPQKMAAVFMCGLALLPWGLRSVSAQNPA